MLLALSFDPTDKTPSIDLDIQKGIFQISGRSLPENSLNFYEPVLNWINHYSQRPNLETNFVFRLEYMNTSSSKAVLDILVQLEDIKGSRVTWYSYPEDDDMKSAGQVLAELVTIPFTFQTLDHTS